MLKKVKNMPRSSECVNNTFLNMAYFTLNVIVRKNVPYMPYSEK